MGRVVSAMAAVGGAVWVTAENGAPKLQYQVNLAQSGVEASARSRSRHSLLLRSVADGGQAVIAPPSSGPASDTGPGNPTELLIVLAPLIVEQENHGVVEIFQRPGSAPSAQRGYLRFLLQMGDLACATSKAARQLEETHLWRHSKRCIADSTFARRPTRL
jgi:hypothetical protein